MNLSDDELEKIKSDERRKARAEAFAEVLEIVNVFELDSKAHRNGKCSFNVLCLCSNLEQETKMNLTEAIKARAKEGE